MAKQQKQPKYDPEALQRDIEREDQNVLLFLGEIEKAQVRKAELMALLAQAKKE